MLYILTEEKLDDTGAQMETNTTKCSCFLAAQSQVSKCSAYSATKLLKIFPYKIKFIQHRFPLNWEVRSWYCM